MNPPSTPESRQSGPRIVVQTPHTPTPNSGNADGKTPKAKSTLISINPTSPRSKEKPKRSNNIAPEPRIKNKQATGLTQMAPKATLTVPQDNLEEDSDSDFEGNVPEWATYENLKDTLEEQSLHHDIVYDLFSSDLFHPPIAAIMKMNAAKAKLFQQRSDSADWSHINEFSPKKRMQVWQEKEISTLSRQWALKDFEIGRTLGKGRFATVYLSRERKSGTIVVLKIIYKAVLAELGAEKSLRSEIEINAHLNHKNLIRIYGYFSDEERIYLVLEYAMNGDLLNEVQLCRLDERQAAGYIFQIACGLQHMHKHYVIHRDIKLDNIYLNAEGEIKIGDFGWAVHKPKNLEGQIVGTKSYLAPEMLLGQNYDYRVDIWSLGVVAYAMIVGELPFFGDNDAELEQNILNAKPKIPGFVSKPCKDLLVNLLKKNPEERITLEELFSHPWITEMNSPPSLKELCIQYIRETNDLEGYDLSVLDPELIEELDFDAVHHRFLSE